MAERTPFLARHDDGDDYEHHPIKIAPANSHFKRPLTIMTALISFLSLAMFALVIASYVLVSTGPFIYIWSSQEALRDLAIVLGVNFISTTPTIFIQLPILINMAVHIAMSVVVLIFSSELFSGGFPDSSFCQRWEYKDGRSRRLPGTYACEIAKRKVQITTGVSGGISIIIGVLILNLLLLRVIALARTKFWVGKSYRPNLRKWGFNPRGFTVQFTLKVLPAGEESATESIQNKPRNVEASTSEEQARLIET